MGIEGTTEEKPFDKIKVQFRMLLTEFLEARDLGLGLKELHQLALFPGQQGGILHEMFVAEDFKTVTSKPLSFYSRVKPTRLD
jgi:hypothetical protein